MKEKRKPPTIPVPAGICKRCALDPRQTKILDGTTVLASYCPHNKTGGLILLNGDRLVWTLYTPFSSAEWAAMVYEQLAEAKRGPSEARHATH